ncbi:MAG: DUF3368 domain-containing protein [Planctomycetes bacterium]|nr:DUF3368 domain-containing protein [Planctomycetota bacterium]
MPVPAVQGIVAVADASFVIGLSAVGQWRLLEGRVRELYVPSAVWAEVVEQGRGRPGASELQSEPIVRRRAARDRRAVGRRRAFLGSGEAEALVLAQELGNVTVLLDDPRARRAAKEAGLPTTGLLGFLVGAKQRGHLREIRPLLDALRAHGFRLSRALIKTTLRDAGESPGCSRPEQGVFWW